MAKDTAATKVLIHLHGGQTIETYDEGIDSIEDLEQRVSNGPPRWTRIGDVCFHTQAASAVELG